MYTLSLKGFILRNPNIIMAVAPEIFSKILDCLLNKKATVYQIVYYTKLNSRTVIKYLEMIETIQSYPKLKKETKGSRVYLKLE